MSDTMDPMATSGSSSTAFAPAVSMQLITSARLLLSSAKVRRAAANSTRTPANWYQTPAYIRCRMPAEGSFII